MMKHLAALTAFATLVAGCGAPLPAAEPSAPTFKALQAEAPERQQPPDVTEILPFLAGTDLTAAQKSGIEELLREQQPPISQEEAKERGERFLSLLSEREFPTEALRAYFTQAQETARQDTAASAALFAGIRARLTPTQRTMVAANIRRAQAEAEQAPSGEEAAAAETPAQGAPEAQPLDLELTEAQQAAFAALAPQQGPEAISAALATFFEDGDQAALLAAMYGPTSVADQVQKLLAAYASLTLAQRLKLVSHTREQQQQANQPEAGS